MNKKFYNNFKGEHNICQAQKTPKAQLLKLVQQQARTGAEIKMENGEKKEVMQEKAEIKKNFFNNNISTIRNSENNFYGGADMKFSRIKIISEIPLPEENGYILKKK